jgi:succinoglycan biosynthesis protein ExoA
MTSPTTDPSVSVIMPVREEGRRLGPVLEAVCAQDYPNLHLIVIALAPSSHDTTDVVSHFRESDPRVIVVPNPAGIVSTGLNEALRISSSELVVRIDGHCLVPHDYVSRLVKAMGEVGADCVGPRLETIGHGWRQEGIAAAMSSRFGVGGSQFRVSEKSGYVDTVPFGLYKRHVLNRIGWFRVELVRNQDDELNSRVRRAGGKIYMESTVVVQYFPRESLWKLLVQYAQYGYWRVVSARFMDNRPRLRQLAPVGLIGAMAGGLAIAPVSTVPLKLVLLGYTTSLGACTLDCAKRSGSVTTGLVSAVAALCMHTGYGAGAWWAIVRVRAVPRPPAPCEFSRPTS